MEPERSNEWVTVETSRRQVRITWSSRQALLARLRDVSGAVMIVDAFELVGRSRPVTLDTADKDLLQTILNAWLEEVTEVGLPTGILELRNALIDDAYDRGARPRGPG